MSDVCYQCISFTADRKLLIDTLPVVGTEAAIDALHDIIKAEPAIIREYTSYIFTGLAFPIAPTKEYVRRAKILMEDPIVQNYYPARRAALLAYGGIVHNYCHNKTKCSPELNEFLIVKYNNAPNDTEREFVLKAMGNAGMGVDVAQFIRKLFKQPEKMSIRIQVAALQALRRLALTDPVRLRAILLPIYLDPYYDPEVRITTCKLLFDTNPSVVTLTMLAQQLNTESSNQVVSFVYSHLSALANSTAPVNLPLARAAKMALHFARLRPGLTYRYSKAYHVSAYYECGPVSRRAQEVVQHL
ncbi:vitellogenin-like [Ptychodera flava]|uniref:vitellogenin-like n=1 Tax=Ptychodera flava TaxID=63121 RepID=UPI00396A7522